MPVGIVSLYTFRGKTSTLYRTFPGAALFTVCEKKLQTADPAPACAPTFSRTGTAPNALYHKPGLFEMVILIIPESISILYIMLRFVCRVRNPSAERPQKKFEKGVDNSGGICYHIEVVGKPAVSRGRAVWQLVGLITRRSEVQILPPQLWRRSSVG